MLIALFMDDVLNEFIFSFNQEVSERYKISAMPTFMFFKNEEVSCCKKKQHFFFFFFLV